MNFELSTGTILLTSAGSRAYGIATPESDVDVKGVVIAPKEIKLGFLHNFEQAEGAADIKKLTAEVWPGSSTSDGAENGLEGVVYELCKFMRLATDCNPNILDVLFCRDTDILHSTPAGRELRNNRDKFLSTKAKYTFSGYAIAQLKRIMAHRAWLLSPPKAKPTAEEFGLPEQREVRRTQLSSLMNLSMAELLALGMSEKGAELIRHESMYAAAMAQWESYCTWKRQRNPKRAELEAAHGYDCKHAAHLYRLLSMGIEIMTTGKVNVYRGQIDADVLLDIRNGGWPFEKLVEWAETKQKELDSLYDSGKAVVPKEPDRLFLDGLCVRLHDAHWRK